MPLWIRYDGLEAGGQRGSDVIINQAPPVSTDMRFDRTDRLGRDGQVAGPDLISKRVWDFTLFTNQRTEDEAIALAQAWEQAWRDSEVRSGRRLVPLEYSRNRESWFRVYGRPTLFTGPEVDVLTRQGRGQIDLQFEQLRPWHYSDSESSVRIGSAPGQGSAGWVAPFVFPLVSGSLGAPVDGGLTNSGDRPAPLTVTFAGQVTEPRVRNLETGAVVGVRGSLAWDERITVDAHAETVELWRVGDPHVKQSVPGRLIRATRLTKMTVAPGQNSYEFRSQAASDAFVELSCPSAFTSLQ